MPAPKDPKKKEEWKRKLSEKGKGRKTWNTGLKYSEIEGYGEYRDKLSKAHKGRKREPLSEETKKKISNSLIGKQKGKIVSQETRDKLSKAMSGRERSEEHKRNISKGRTGIKVSPEARQKMSRDRKGKPGTPHTDETKAKLSKLGKEKGWRPTGGMVAGGIHTEATKGKISASGIGRSKSEEHKEKIGKALRGRKRTWYTSGFAGKKKSDESKAKVSATLLGMHARGEITLSVNPTVYQTGVHKSPKAGVVKYRSSYELIIFKKLDLDEKVVRYEVEKLCVPYIYKEVERTYRPDIEIFYIDGSTKVIEIKPTELLLHPQNQAKFLAAKSLYDNFEVWTESDLETNL